MKKLIMLATLIALLIEAQYLPVSSQGDKVLCCYYCTSCKEQKCETITSLDCMSNEGTVVASCSECEASRRREQRSDQGAFGR